MYAASARREEIRERVHLEVEQPVEGHEGRGRVVAHARQRRPVVLQRGGAPPAQRQQRQRRRRRAHRRRHAAQPRVCAARDHGGGFVTLFCFLIYENVWKWR